MRTIYQPRDEETSEFVFVIQDLKTGDTGSANVSLHPIDEASLTWSCTARVGNRKVNLGPRATDVRLTSESDVVHIAAVLIKHPLREEGFALIREPSS